MDNRQPYIAYPRKTESVDDIKNLVIMRNCHSDETNTGKYIAFNSYGDACNFMGLSCSQFKWFIDDAERMKNIAIGGSIEECIDRLIEKLNG